ncbi:MAG: histidine kinase [Candidatus Cloacimonetes bacterium]|nr:histidine kinase [Candidatus Cloacimonadota bacterium]MBL7148647.1 histidine kinase [Candidatus Cloacimonadota bacterium]
MDTLDIINHEIQMNKWWSKIRWFIVLILFAIGILRVNQIVEIYPIVVFVSTFIGICVLNMFFHMQIIRTNTLFSSLQILLDIVFATLVVHLTGGLNSSFVWIYLIAVITASLNIENLGGILAAMIGSMCLLMLILMYNFGWLATVSGETFDADVASQTIFLISYTGLFSGIAFVSNFLSDLMKKIAVETQKSKDLIKEQESVISEKQKEIIQNKESLEKYKEVVSVAASLASIDHDINNPLTIISLSIRRVIKAAQDYKDDMLVKAGDQMTEAINGINGILARLQKLKNLELIQKESKNQD